MATHKTNTVWKGNMQFESSNPGGSLKIDVGEDLGGNSDGLRPKALMLSALAGCSGLDVASLMKKMRLEVSDFFVETEGFLSDTEPAVYEKVIVIYNFVGENLNEEKLTRAVDLSVEKYCGVMHMFRSFAEIEIKIVFNK